MPECGVAALAGIAAALAGWVIIGAAIVLRAAGARGGRVTARDAGGLAGMMVQGAGLACVWGIRRPICSPLDMVPPWIGTVLAALLSGAGAALVVAAVRTLGRQWSLKARILENHALMSTGPFALVRHPVYAGMLPLMFALGLALSTWPAIIAGFLLYAAGSVLRIRSEERLLRVAFGRTYADYAARVPAFLPWPRPRRGAS